MKLRNLLFGFVCVALAGSANAQEFDIKQGDAIVSALNFGKGDHVVIALHGYQQGRNFFKDYGDEIAKAGFRVISIDWSGDRGSGFNEVGAAVKFAREQGAKKLSLLGTSRGAELAANYARAQPDGEFDTLILFASIDDQGIPLTKTKKLFVFSKYDSKASWTPTVADKSAEPKQLIMLGGSGHGLSNLVAEKADLMQDVIAALKR